MDLSFLSPEQTRWLMDSMGRTASPNSFGPLTKEQRAALAKDAVMPFALDALPAIEDAVREPSLGSITNAGVQTATMFGRPLAALGMLAGGYGAAGAQDAGLTDMSAHAQSVRESRAQANAARAAAEAAKARAAAEIAIQEAKTKAEKEAAERRKKEADEAIARAEYNRKVLMAEDMRNQALSRDRRFSETEVGKVYDKTGGAAGLLAPFAVGLINRAAHGPGGGAVSKYIAPGIEGAAAAYGVNTLPLYYNAYATEPDNPKKQAWAAYGQYLPEGHPSKAEALRYGGLVEQGGLPDENPVQKRALDELNTGFGKRLMMSAVEGTMAPLGFAVGNVPRRIGAKLGDAVEEVSTLPGRALKGYHSSMAEADAARAARANSATGAGPSPGGPSGVGAGSAAGYQQQPPPPPQGGSGGLHQTSPGPAFAPYNQTTHGVSSRQFLDDILTQARSANANPIRDDLGPRMAQTLEARYAAQGLPPVDPTQLAKRARGTADELAMLDQLLRHKNIRRTVTAPEQRNAILNAATGRDWTLALPFAMGGPAVGSILGRYYGDEGN